MSWQLDYSVLESIMPLKGNTISVTYAERPGEGLDKRLRICQAMQSARKGHSFNVTAQNQVCKGGHYFCGFLPEPTPGHEEFLANEEHIFASVAAAKRNLFSGPPMPSAGAGCIFIAPLEQTTHQPDLVLFFCQPIHASQLLGLTVYRSGPVRQVYATGATCRAAIAHPLMTGEPQISFVDMAARRRYGFKPEELIVALPLRWLEEAIKNLEAKKKLPRYDPLKPETGTWDTDVNG